MTVPPLFTASFDATGTIVTVVANVDPTVAVDVTMFGQTVHLSEVQAPVFTGDSDSKVWTVTGPAADGKTFTATRGA